MIVWIVLNKYLLNVNIYLFDTKTNLIWQSFFYSINKYLFTVSKCLLDTIKRKIY